MRYFLYKHTNAHNIIQPSPYHLEAKDCTEQKTLFLNIQDKYYIHCSVTIFDLIILKRFKENS